MRSVVVFLPATRRPKQRGDITAVKDLDLKVGPGEFLTLLGASVAGKRPRCA